MENIINELESLANKSQKSKKLNKTDRKKAKDHLVLLLKSPEYLEKGLALILRLPAETAGTSIADAWINSDDNYKKEIIQNVVKNDGFRGIPGQNRLVEIIREFISISIEVTVELLVFYCDQVTGSNSKRPAPKIITGFRKKLIDNMNLMKIPLQEIILTPNDMSLISATTLFALFTAEAGEIGDDYKLISTYINWLNQSNTRPTLSSKIQTEVEKETKKWPEDLQRLCNQTGLISTIITRIEPPGDQEKITKKESAWECHGHGQIADPVFSNTRNNVDIQQGLLGRSTEEDHKRTTENNEPFNPLLYLDRLKQYVTDLEKEKKLLQFRSQKIQQELEVIKSERTRINQQLIEKQSTVQKLQENFSKLNKELDERNTEVGELKEKICELENSHQTDVNKLLDQIQDESDIRLKEFRTGLGFELQRYYLEFLEICKDEMTIGRGQHLSNRMQRIFSVLSKKGIPFNER
jgi:hypothetical protein